jgi:hypothetical protein
LKYSKAHQSVLIDYLTQLALCDYETGRLKTLKEICEEVDLELYTLSDDFSLNGLEDKWRSQVRERKMEVGSQSC